MAARPRAEETRDSILDFYRRVATNTTAVVEELAFDTRGYIGHWPPERRNPTLHELLVRMVVKQAGTQGMPTSSASR